MHTHMNMYIYICVCVSMYVRIYPYMTDCFISHAIYHWHFRRVDFWKARLRGGWRRVQTRRSLVTDLHVEEPWWMDPLVWETKMVQNGLDHGTFTLDLWILKQYCMLIFSSTWGSFEHHSMLQLDGTQIVSDHHCLNLNRECLSVSFKSFQS